MDTTPKPNLLVGLIAVLGVWLTGGIGFPLVNYLAIFSIGQILVARGTMTAIVPFIQLRGQISASRNTAIAAAWLAVTAFTVFMGFRAWGINPTVVMTTTCPVFNFIFAWRTGRKVSTVPVLICALVIAGVTIALQPWQGTFVLSGFMWSLTGAIAGALFYEVLKKSHDSPAAKCFWQGAMMVIAGALTSFSDSWGMIASNPRLLLTLGVFGLLVGYLNLLANTKAIQNMDPEIVGILVQGETAVAILFAGLLLGEGMTPSKWAGVALALGGAWLLGQWLKKGQATLVS